MSMPPAGAGRGMGEAGWLVHSGAAAGETLDVRTLCLIRETLARHDGLADFAFAMQGLGMGALSCSERPNSAAGSSRRAPARRSPPSRSPSRPPAPMSPT
jgi:hypothetical protein